jgi:hypothetical protein
MTEADFLALLDTIAFPRRYWGLCDRFPIDPAVVVNIVPRYDRFSGPPPYPRPHHNQADIADGRLPFVRIAAAAAARQSPILDGSYGWQPSIAGV